MNLAHHHLHPIFENITLLLSPTPGMLELFEPWADAQTARLLNAAQHGTASLAYEADLMREELLLLTPPPSIQEQLTERTDRMRLCQRQWLTGLLDFVDDLLNGAELLSMSQAA